MPICGLVCLNFWALRLDKGVWNLHWDFGVKNLEDWVAAGGEGRRLSNVQAHGDGLPSTAGAVCSIAETGTRS